MNVNSPLEVMEKFNNNTLTETDRLLDSFTTNSAEHRLVERLREAAEYPERRKFWASFYQSLHQQVMDARQFCEQQTDADFEWLGKVYYPQAGRYYEELKEHFGVGRQSVLDYQLTWLHYSEGFYATRSEGILTLEFAVDVHGLRIQLIDTANAPRPLATREPASHQFNETVYAAEGSNSEALAHCLTLLGDLAWTREGTLFNGVDLNA